MRSNTARDPCSGGRIQVRCVLVEDTVWLIDDALRVHGSGVDRVGTGEDAKVAPQTLAYDARVPDLGLPDRDGMTVLPSRGGGRRGCPLLWRRGRFRDGRFAPAARMGSGSPWRMSTGP